MPLLRQAREHLERHPLETAGDHHLAAAGDDAHAARRAIRARHPANGASTDRQARTSPAVIAP